MSHGLETLARVSPVLGEERFGRMVRTLMRLLQIPAAVVAVNDEDGPWLHAVQGLAPGERHHALAFCDPQLMGDRPLLVNDAAVNPLFCTNRLVTGTAAIRSILAVPIARSAGVLGGALCALHLQPRAFRSVDVLALQDLAAMAEAELKLDALAAKHKRVVTRVGMLERRSHFDAVTGCWSLGRFRELLAESVTQVRATGGSLALCCARVKNFKAVAAPADRGRQDAIRRLVAQELRRRLPGHGVLGTLGGGDFCALLPGAAVPVVHQQLAAFSQPWDEGSAVAAGLDMAFSPALLHEMPGSVEPGELLASALAALPA